MNRRERNEGERGFDGSRWHARARAFVLAVPLWTLVAGVVSGCGPDDVQAGPSTRGDHRDEGSAAIADWGTAEQRDPTDVRPGSEGRDPGMQVDDADAGAGPVDSDDLDEQVALEPSLDGGPVVESESSDPDDHEPDEDGPSDEASDPVSQVAADLFYERTHAAESDRPGDLPTGEEFLDEGTIVEEWNATHDRLAEFREQSIRKTVRLEQLVMKDNTIGKVYPGSFLWADPVRDGRLQQLRAVPGRPEVTVSFTNRLQQGAEESAVVTHDGSFSDFTREAQPVFSAGSSGAGSVSARFTVSSSLEDAVMSAGLSASHWVGEFESSLDLSTRSVRSVAVMSLDQAFFSAAVDAPPPGGYLPEDLVRADPMLAEDLAAGALEGGEVCYVRKVDYGRRVLVVLTSEAYTDELRAALDVTARYAAGEAEGSFDMATREVWESTEGRIVVVGGSFPEGVDEFFSGDVDAFVQSVQSILSAEFVNDVDNAAPVSFELAYASDDAPMQVYETVEFAGKIPLRRWGVVSHQVTVSTDGSDARVERDDSEVDSDDWTMVRLQHQRLRPSSDGRGVLFDLLWKTYEGNGDRSRTRTVIASDKTFHINLGRQVREILSPTDIGSRDQWYRGENHSLSSFPNHGLLSNVRVRFDARGGNDKDIQHLRATLGFDVLLQE